MELVQETQQVLITDVPVLGDILEAPAIYMFAVGTFA